MLSNNLDNLRRFDLNHVIKAGMVSLVLCLIVIYGGPARSADEYVFYKYYDDIGEIVHTDEILEDTWVVFFTRYIDRFPKKYVDCVVVEKNGWKFSILISPLPSNVLGLDNIVYFNRFDREYFLYYSTGVY